MRLRGDGLTSKTRVVAAAAVFIAVSTLFELLPKPRVPWGMSIDFTAVPVVLAFFLFGVQCALITSIGMFVILNFIGFFPPVGAVMKLTATLPMFLVPALLLYTPLSGGQRTPLIFKSPLKVLVAGVLAIAVRCLVMVALNYYWAIPIFASVFFGISFEEFFEKQFGGIIWAFIWYVASMNMTQGVIDIAVSWLVAFKAKLADMFSYYQIKP